MSMNENCLCVLVVTKTAKVSVLGVGLGLDHAGLGLGLGLGLPGLGLGLGLSLSGLGLVLPGLDNISGYSSKGRACIHGHCVFNNDTSHAVTLNANVTYLNPTLTLTLSLNLILTGIHKNLPDSCLTDVISTTVHAYWKNNRIGTAPKFCITVSVKVKGPQIFREYGTWNKKLS